MDDERISDKPSKKNHSKPWLRMERVVEVSLPILIIILVIFSWFVAHRYQQTLVDTVITAYQETQLEVVRSVARSIRFFVGDRLAHDFDIDTIEQQILKRFVAPIHLLQNGDAWIYAPDHVVFDLSSDFPEIYRGKSMAEIFAMQKEKGAFHYADMCEAVAQAREGIGWYVWLPDKGKEIASWTPVRFENHVWTIGLSTPLNEVLQATGAQRRKRLINALMALATLFAGCFSLTALWGFRHRRQLQQAVEQHNQELQDLVADLENEVSRRSQSEVALRELHDRLDTLIEALPDVIHFKDAKGCNLVVNKAYEKRVGLDKQQILGKRDEDLLPPDLTDSSIAADTFVREQKEALRYEEVQRLADGREIYWDTFKAPLFDNDGQLAGLVCISRDVTDNKEAEKERQRLNEQLMHAQKMEAIGALAGGVAHDLNNILSGIISYPELLIARLPEDSSMIRPLQTIQASGEQAASIVQDLLTLAKRGSTQKEIINLNSIVNEYLQSPAHLKKAMQHPHVKIETQLDNSLMHLRGAPADLTKIVMNLVINAFESFKKPGSITISTENRYIDGLKIGTTKIPEGEYVQLKVADTGSGIAADDLPRIFEPFYTKKNLGMSGSGLGLAVVWGTILDHFGAIDVHSTKGKGTVFNVFLPATRQDLPHPIDRIDQETLMAKGESILVVDDVPLQRDIAQRILEMLGYQVHLVDCGEAAVTFVKGEAVDLVVLDMIMGRGMDGLDTYRSICNLYPGQKAIIASGFAETERVREAQQLGAGAYVKKPFLLETLALAIRQELDR
ncbi:two component system sensor histidine kinase, hybrid [Desulfosarcina variabilis str. Montpellier]|uniref:hybrid sensor histidine kinase/response regulator n=1 Tax=Desulfosarcina variabilis TaxID=2300 RepID=UPI003AFA75DC